MTEKTLFVKIGGDYEWTGEQIEQLADEICEVTDDEVSVIVTPDMVEYVDKGTVEELIEGLQSIVEDAG